MRLFSWVESFLRSFEMFKNFIMSAIWAVSEMEVQRVKDNKRVLVGKRVRRVRGRRDKSLKERSNRRKAKLKARRK